MSAWCAEAGLAKKVRNAASTATVNARPAPRCRRLLVVRGSNRPMDSNSLMLEPNAGDPIAGRQPTLLSKAAAARGLRPVGKEHDQRNGAPRPGAEWFSL